MNIIFAFRVKPRSLFIFDFIVLMILDGQVLIQDAP
jgi:hypothetical protein